MSKKVADLKLNLGCGWSGINGWINYDWGILPLLSRLKLLRRMLIKYGLLDKVYDQDWPNLRLVNIRRRLPLKDNSVKFIYCSHVLEHFERWQAVEILRECRRVLRTGGCIRIVVPDLKKMIGNYNDSKNSPRASDEFFREVWGFNKDRPSKNIIDKIKTKFIRGHGWGYDEKGMEAVLLEAGFQKIKGRKFCEGDVPDIKLLDHKIHQWISLYIEAKK